MRRFRFVPPRWPILSVLIAALVNAGAAEEVAPPIAPNDPVRAIRVALFDDAGAAGKGIPRVTEQLSKFSDIHVTKVRGSEIADGVLKDFDVVIFTGGSGHREADSLSEKGRAQVRDFVRGGGGYVGICAGAYLACSGFQWGIGVLNARTVSDKWQRGNGTVKIEVNALGHEIVGLTAAQHDIRYDNGPIIKPDSRDDIGAYEILASFRTEVAEHGAPAGVMVDSPAIVRGVCGKGRVIVSSPHPEQTPGMENFIESAVRWVAGKGSGN